MGQRCTKRWITEEDIQISKQIESSYSVRKENPCSFTCISAGINPYVERDPEHKDIENNENSIMNTEVLFDSIDHGLSATSLSPLVYVSIMFSIKIVGVPILTVYHEEQWIRTLIVLPQICIIQPIIWGLYFRRCTLLREALIEWNREYGSKQGIEAYLGFQDMISFRSFLHGLNKCCGGKVESHVHFCRIKQNY